MALGFFKLFKQKDGATAVTGLTEVSCRELLDAALEYQIRELCWWSCVNWIANIIGRCEVRTYAEGKEVRGKEYYLWNVEPNTNQNSTAFWHKAVARLYEDNELLIVPVRRRDGTTAVAVADAWTDPDWLPARRNEYRNVRVWDFTYDKTFYEDEVLHLKLNHVDMKPVNEGIYKSYLKLVQTAMSAYGWANGQHWKVHVNQIAQGQEGWAEAFQRMLDAQIKPFLQSTARSFGIPAVLVRGEVEATNDAMRRALTVGIDPICDQFSEEATRKRYGFDQWQQGSYLKMDSSTVQHFDLFANAANIEKLLGSGWSLNDIRRAAGEEPINEPWANEHLITKNIGRLGAAEEA